MSEDVRLAGRLIDGGHELDQRVYFEDTDFSGRVYHARYLHFLERGRSDYLRMLGVHHRELTGEGLGFVVSRMDIEFRRPATIDDVISIRTARQTLGGARLVLRQTAWRGPDQLIEAMVTVVLIEASGRPVRLPAAIRTAFGAG